MRLNIKFVMAFLSLVLLSAILAFIGVSGVNFQVSTGKTVFEGSLVPVANLAKMMIKFDALHSDLRDLVEADSLAKADWAFIKMKVPMRDYDDLLDQYIRTIPNNPLTADEKIKIVEDIKEQKHRLVERLVRVSELARAGRQAESIALFEKDLKPVIHLMSANIRLLVDVSIQDASSLGGAMEASRSRAVLYMFAALAAVAITSALICLALRYFVVKAQDELHNAYKDTAAILREIPAPICVICKNGGIILDANDAFVRMCSAQGPSEVLGLPLTRFFGRTESGDDIEERLRRGASFKCMLEKDDGPAAEVEIFARPFVFKAQESFALYCMDLTRQRIQERAMRDAVTAAEEASRMKSAFVANISHEIRTPLNGVIGFAELALDEPGLSGRVADYLDKIRVSANGLLGIINDVLDLSKIESGKMELEKAVFDLNEVISQCEVISRANAREKGIELEFDLGWRPERKIIGDPTKLRQVLLNLLSNAIKFTNSGFVRLSCLPLRHDGESVIVMFEVRDSGIGMNRDQLGKIFQPFTQADSSTTRKYGGTGLGLAITKSIIELMGGRLTVESSLGEGSRFSFVLSFVLSDIPAGSSPEEAETAFMRPVFDGSVLVCEDNAINQQVITGHLARIGLKAVIASNGEEGVRLAREYLDAGRRFDLILMDIHMPVMDGLCATGLLNDMGLNIPIIAMTANAMSGEKDLYLARGMSDYIGKPFNSRELWSCLLKFLRPARFEPVSGKNRAAGDAGEGVIIDAALGLERAAGSEELYRNLQAGFVKDNRGTMSELQKALDRGDIKSAHRIAHTLKGVGGTIGAVELQKAAQDVEAALAGNEGRVDHGLLGRLEAALNAVLALLEPLAREKELENGRRAAHGQGELDLDKAFILLDDLERLLNQGNSASVELAGEVLTVLGPVGDKGELLAAQIDDFEFESAGRTAREIRKILEGMTK